MRRFILYLLCYLIYRCECGKHLHNLTWETAKERCIYRRTWFDRALLPDGEFMYKCRFHPDFVYFSREFAVADGWCIVDNKKKDEKHYDCVKKFKDAKRRTGDIPKSEPKPK